MGALLTLAVLGSGCGLNCACAGREITTTTTTTTLPSSDTFHIQCQACRRPKVPLGF